MVWRKMFDPRLFVDYMFFGFNFIFNSIVLVGFKKDENLILLLKNPIKFALTETSSPRSTQNSTT